MNYYQHHIGDFIRDTARLSDAQSMTYLRLLWMYYETEEPLECDVDAIAFKIGANVSDVQQILRHFFFEHDARWHHSRCDKEILAFREKSKKAKESANARWDNAHAMRTHNKRNADERVFDANQEPITNNQEPKINTGASAKRGKPAAERPQDVPETVWSDFLAIRKAKRAPLTKTALAGIEREAQRAGMTLAQALAISCERGWQGFNSEWVARDRIKMPTTTGEPAWRAEQRNRVMQAVPSIAARPQQANVIEMESPNAPLALD